MSPDPSGWLPYEPGDDALPAGLAGGESSGGEVVVLAVLGDDPDLTEWAGRGAVSLARAWAAASERLLLLDLGLEDPGLHRILETENGEGTADVFLFGASLQHVARPVSGASFLFAPAGSPVADPESVLRHDRWDALIQGFRDAGARLLLHLPLELQGSASLLERADRIVVLASPGVELPAQLEDGGSADVVLLHPPEAPEPEGAETDAAEEPVVDIADLAPDPEPAVEAPVAASAAPAEMGDAADLATEEAVVDIAELAPDEPLPADEGAPAGDGGSVEDELRESEGPVPSEESPTETVADDFASVGAGSGADASPEDGSDESVDEAEDDLGMEFESGGDEGDGEELDDFDLGALDELAEGAAAGAEEIGDPPASVGDEAPEDDVDDGRESLDDEEPGLEPAAESDFGDLSGELDEESWEDEDPSAEEFAPAEESGPAEEAGPGDEGAFDFGDFGGELEAEELEEEEEEEAVDEAPDTEPAFADAAGDPSEEDADADFGDDLVTGPDFGGGGPGDVPDWESDEGEADESPGVDEGEGVEGPRSGEEGDVGVARPQDEAAAAPGGAPTAEDEEGEEAPAEEATPSDRTESGRPGRLVLLLLLVLAGAGAGHWFGLFQVPGLDRALATFLGPAGTGRAPVVETVDPEPAMPVLGYSLAVDAYRDVTAAREVASALRGRLSDRLFVVAPVQIDGEVFYRLLAGPALNAEEASALRDPLAGVLTREDPDEWVVRATPLAFLLEEASSLDAARSRASTLGGQGISAYVLEVEYPDGTEGYRVYSGAYESPDEARALQGMLDQAGFADPTFTERRGRLPE